MIRQLDFWELLEEHRDKLLRIAIGVAGSPEDGEDLLQRSAIHAARSFENFRGDCSFTSWMTRCIKQRQIEHWRRNRVTTVSPELLEGTLHEVSKVVSPAERIAVEQCLTEAPEHYREAVVAYANHGFLEGSRALGLSLSAFKARVYRGQALLRRLASGEVMG